MTKPWPGRHGGGERGAAAEGWRARRGRGGCTRRTGAAGPRTSPHIKDRSSYAGCSVCLVEDVFQNLCSSFLSCTPGRCLLAARDNLPSLPHPARLSASCLPLPAKLSLTGRAPVPGHEQGHARSRQSSRPRPWQTAGRELRAAWPWQRSGPSASPGPC